MESKAYRKTRPSRHRRPIRRPPVPQAPAARCRSAPSCPFRATPSSSTPSSSSSSSASATLATPDAIPPASSHHRQQHHPHPNPPRPPDACSTLHAKTARALHALSVLRRTLRDQPSSHLWTWLWRVVRAEHAGCGGCRARCRSNSGCAALRGAGAVRVWLTLRIRRL